MKTIAYAAASLLAASLLLASPACAQMPAIPGPAPGPAPAPAPGPNPYEAGFEDGMRAAMAHMGEGGMMGHMKGMHETGAHVKLSKGDAAIDLKCASGDSTEDCVNSAIIVLDHVAAQKKETAQAKPAPQPSGPASPPPAGSAAPQTH